MSRHNVQHTPIHTPAHRRFTTGAFLAALLLVLLVVSVFAARTGSREMATSSTPSGSVLVLALPAFMAGVLSFLSPCCLPILSAYFALTFQARREQVVLMTVAFFFGLATTMVVLGATATAISRLLFGNLQTLTLIGGLIVIAFGAMSLLGKGFTGVRLLDRPNASIAGSFVYGATFALGWTACVGPILGAVLTLLAAQGTAVLEGALLAFIYALGIGTPLVLTATWWSRLGHGSPFWRIVRGQNLLVKLGFTTLHLHTTSVASGVLLIMMGTMLATGQLSVFSRWAVQTPLTQWVLGLDDGIKRLFVGP